VLIQPFIAEYIAHGGNEIDCSVEDVPEHKILRQKISINRDNSETKT